MQKAIDVNTSKLIHIKCINIDNKDASYKCCKGCNQDVYITKGKRWYYFAHKKSRAKYCRNAKSHAPNIIDSIFNPSPEAIMSGGSIYSCIIL